MAAKDGKDLWPVVKKKGNVLRTISSRIPSKGKKGEKKKNRCLLRSKEEELCKKKASNFFTGRWT